jgi:hypothetical protein
MKLLCSDVLKNRNYCQYSFKIPVFELIIPVEQGPSWEVNTHPPNHFLN